MRAVVNPYHLNMCFAMATLTCLTHEMHACCCSHAPIPGKCQIWTILLLCVILIILVLMLIYV